MHQLSLECQTLPNERDIHQIMLEICWKFPNESIGRLIEAEGYINHIFQINCLVDLFALDHAPLVTSNGFDF